MSARRPVVVTGGAGFIGSHVVDRLLADGDPVVVLDDLSSGAAANLPPEVALESIDLAAPATIALLTRLRPAAVVHAAAQPSVVASLRDPVADARTNILGSLQVLTGIRAASCRRLIYVTSGGAMYGEGRPDGHAHREDDPVAPASPYGLSKWTVEAYLRILQEPGTWTALRLANVYGPRQRSDQEGGVVSIFADRMRQGAPVEIYGDGQQTRDFVHVADVVEAIVLALHAGSGPLNIGTGVAVSINELFAAMAALTGYDRPPVWRPERPGDLRHSHLDPARAASQLGWRPRVALRDGLHRMLEGTRPPDRQEAS